MTVTITVTGAKEASAELRRLEEGAREAGRLQGWIATNTKYARYVEFGTGAMRGRFYMTRARDALVPLIPGLLAPAIRLGAAAVRAAFQTILFRGLARAQANAPVRTGQLRGSLYTRLGSR